MKHLKYAAIILMLAMFTSCVDDHGPREYIRTLYNGQEWQAKARGYTNLEEFCGVHGRLESKFRTAFHWTTKRNSTKEFQNKNYSLKLIYFQY